MYPFTGKSSKKISAFQMMKHLWFPDVREHFPYCEAVCLHNTHLLGTCNVATPCSGYCRHRSTRHKALALLKLTFQWEKTGHRQT